MLPEYLAKNRTMHTSRKGHPPYTTETWQRPAVPHVGDKEKYVPYEKLCRGDPMPWILVSNMPTRMQWYYFCMAQVHGI